MRQFVDSLEPRQLLAFSLTAGSAATVAGGSDFRIVDASGGALTATVVGAFKVSKTGTLFLSGTARADKLSLHVKNGKVIGGTRFVTIVKLDDGNHARLFAPGPVGSTRIKRVDVSGLGGNDVITVVADVPVSVRGAAGNDTISVYAPQRTIVGGSGTNTITEGDEAAGSAFPFTDSVLASFSDGANSDLVHFVTPAYLPTGVTVAPIAKPVKHGPHGN